MRRLDRGSLRSAGFITLLVVVFLTVNTTVAAAADSGGQQEMGGLLAPLNVTTSEGVPLEGYQLGADGGSVTNLGGQTRVLLLGGLFTLVRLLVGLACWLIEFAFKFPLWTALMHPAQKAADAYNTHVVGALGLQGLLLGWAFVFGLVLFARGKVGRGLGEIVLTLLIAAFAASAFIRPDYLLAKGGPLDQTHQAAIEVAQITTSSYFGSKATGSAGDPCAHVVGPAAESCDASAAQAQDVARPIQDTLTNALIVKPFMLLEYGQILDPKRPEDVAAYGLHLRWVAGGYSPHPATGPSKEDPCRYVDGIAKKYCQRGNGEATPADTGLLNEFTGPGDPQFTAFTTDLSKAGLTAQAVADYAKNPTWDRVGAVLLLLIAVFVIALMVCSMTLVLLGTQGADVAATAGGGVTFVWGMLPGPSRSVVWKWLSVFLVSEMVMFAAAMFIPLFGIATDALLVSGPNLMVERLLLLDAMAIAALAFHRRLMSGAKGFGERMAMRMRYAKIGGTHLPGDTSEIGAALAMNSTGGGLGGGGLLGGGSGAHALLGRRSGLLANLTGLTDGSGMPMDPGLLLGDALAEGRRGWAPLGLALRGAHGALIGRRPDDDALARLRKPVGPGGGDGPDGAGGQAEPGTPGGMSVNKKTGEILHDPNTHRPLLGTRLHNHAVRYRGARIAMRGGRLAYGATIGLAGNVKGGGRGVSQFTADARTQLSVSANQVRDDAREWAPLGRAAMNTGRAAGRGIDHLSQSAATTWTVHGAPFVRDTTAGAALFVAPSQVDDPGPQPRTASTRTLDDETHARRTVFDALMGLQRRAWGRPTPWGGDDE